jgi:hypothetical protein
MPKGIGYGRKKKKKKKTKGANKTANKIVKGMEK